MGKFRTIKKMLAMLVLVFFVASLTAASVSAKSSDGNMATTKEKSTCMAEKMEQTTEKSSCAGYVKEHAKVEGKKRYVYYWRMVNIRLYPQCFLTTNNAVSPLLGKYKAENDYPGYEAQFITKTEYDFGAVVSCKNWINSLG